MSENTIPVSVIFFMSCLIWAIVALFGFPSKQKLLILRRKKVPQTILSMSVYLSHRITCLIYKLTSSDIPKDEPSWILFKFTTLDSIYKRVSRRRSWETESNLRSECVLIFQLGVIIILWARLGNSGYHRSN